MAAESAQFRTKIRITLITDQNGRLNERFYGPGVQELLKWIQTEGSVKDACVAMGLSYTKGRRILSHAEAVLGYALVDRKQGGSKGGSSTLTPQALAFMEKYDSLTSSVSEYAQEKSNQLFYSS